MLFFEPKRRYWDEGRGRPTPLDAAPLLDRARSCATGTDVTLVAYGPIVMTALRRRRLAAPTRASSIEVVDLRSLSPIDLDHGRGVGAARPAGSSSRTRRRASAASGAEIAARITERCFYHLEAPVLRVGGFDTPYPPAKLEDDFLPDLDRMLDAVDRALAY